MSHTHTRRGFLTAAAGLAVLPAAVVAARPAVPAPTGDPPADPEGLVRAALVAARGAEAALARLAGDPAHKNTDVEYDAAGCRHGVECLLRALECDYDGHLSPHAGKRLNTSLPSLVAARIALFDLLDALLDMTAWHDEDEVTCPTCYECDRAVYVVRQGLHMLACGRGDGIGAYIVVGEREQLSLDRKAERGRMLDAAGRSLPFFAYYEHIDAAAAQARQRQFLAALKK